jgi:hypothetical protein
MYLVGVIPNAFVVYLIGHRVEILQESTRSLRSLSRLPIIWSKLDTLTFPELDEPQLQDSVLSVNL